MKKLVLAAICILSFSVVHANDCDGAGKKELMATGQIEGKVIDKATGEALAGVALKLEGKDKKYYTDFEGNFIIEGVTQGEHDIEIYYISYQSVTVKDIHTCNTELTLKVELEPMSE